MSAAQDATQDVAQDLCGITQRYKDLAAIIKYTISSHGQGLHAGRKEHVAAQECRTSSTPYFINFFKQ